MHDWNKLVKQILKSELIKKGLSTEELTILLNNNGSQETKSAIDSKISRGCFSAAFFVQCLHVLGCNTIEILDYTSNFNTHSNILQQKQNKDEK